MAQSGGELRQSPIDHMLKILTLQAYTQVFIWILLGYCYYQNYQAGDLAVEVASGSEIWSDRVELREPWLVGGGELESKYQRSDLL